MAFLCWLYPVLLNLASWPTKPRPLIPNPRNYGDHWFQFCLSFSLRVRCVYISSKQKVRQKYDFPLWHEFKRLII